ncbi:MAG: hypothetical protein LBM39_00270 [Candidatus Methanoplasma sp.]|jgi:hypothetical protein|nr:hypothetical protein [Candidatus Methanoplasma sp.]
MVVHPPGFIKTFIGYTGPELAVQETLYGFVMALIFISSAQVGIISYSSPWDIVTLIVGMNFVWGVVDMYIFYRMDVTAQRRYAEILGGDTCCSMEEHHDQIYDALGGTVFDALSEKDKERAVELIMDSDVGTQEEMRLDRMNMLLSAITCFVITMLTTIPLILCLVLINDSHGALAAASLVAGLCLFFTGFMLEPLNSFSKKVMTGISISVIALGLTFFATFLGG